MHKQVGRLFALAGAIVLAGVGLSTPASAKDKAADEAAVTAARQAFVGEWSLNKQLSDDPRAKMREGRPNRGGPGGGRWGGGEGEPPEGGGGGRWGGGVRRGVRRGGWGGGPGGGMAREGRPGGFAGGGMLFTADKITITNLTPEITIVGPEATLRTLHADGKGYENAEGRTVKTHWDGARLLVETKSQRGGMKEEWSATTEPRQLTVLVELDRPFGDTVKIKRVFDPFKAETEEPSADTPRPQGPPPPQGAPPPATGPDAPPAP